ncbi:hypothetical protein AUP74_01646 [Microbulbifer aggregans]|uniref:Lipoprotein n=1 Tax=Microbulbifer aggregans TaxID=1769779 RepID=A0A1C9W7F4_9GAMM|nr:hypothetical protein [Microbulbifer aggregans]AOS97079.1 hypothetical protein AUP74_01646 [Microbulbifer aggregans]
MVKKILFVVSVLLVTACSSTPYENFDSATVQGKGSMRLVSQVSQEEMVKEFVPSNSGGSAGAQFGLVGALVGSAIDASVNNSRAQDAEQMVEPFRNALLDLDVRSLVYHQLAENASRIDWVSDVNPVMEQLEAGKKPEDYVLGVDEDLVLMVDTRYSLKPGTEVVEFVAMYALYDKDAIRKAGKSKAKPIYSNTATIQSYPHNASIRRLTESEKEAERQSIEQRYPTDAELAKNTLARNQKNKKKALANLDTKTLSVVGYNPNGSVWLANDGALLREEVQAAPSLLADMVVKDLMGEYPLPELAEGEKRKHPKAPQLLEESENGMVITRRPNGTLLSKHRDAPVYTTFGNVF